MRLFPVRFLPGHLGSLGAALLALVLFGAACTTTARPELSERDPVNTEQLSGVRTEPAADNSQVIVATAVVDTVFVYSRPDGRDDGIEMSSPIPSGGPLVFLVEESEPGWHKVLLPIRPNGSTGWIRETDVTLARNRYRLVVSLTDFDLKVFQSSELVLQATVAVARENAPTPGGRYYITELLQPIERDTLYGQYAYGLSGFSETFQTFEGGPGQLGIHGTNDPDSLGSNVSSGCVRLADGDIEALVGLLPLGTPVEVIA
ncbi:MAG: L,D-transpeptidase [Acidimicrobiales bacterium]|nr:L,D-transpeptidase [Acidimicrobiales bacterium]